MRRELGQRTAYSIAELARMSPTKTIGCGRYSGRLRLLSPVFMPGDTEELFALGFEYRRVVEERQVLETLGGEYGQREMRTCRGRSVTYRSQLVGDIAAEASIIVIVATRKRYIRRAVTAMPKLRRDSQALHRKLVVVPR